MFCMVSRSGTPALVGRRLPFGDLGMFMAGCYGEAGTRPRRGQIHGEGEHARRGRLLGRLERLERSRWHAARYQDAHVGVLDARLDALKPHGSASIALKAFNWSSSRSPGRLGIRRRLMTFVQDVQGAHVARLARLADARVRTTEGRGPASKPEPATARHRTRTGPRDPGATRPARVQWRGWRCELSYARRRGSRLAFPWAKATSLWPFVRRPTQES